MKVILNIVIFIYLLEPVYVFPQFVDFGKNKVMYSNFDWYVLNTEHFNLYYYKEAKELAEKWGKDHPDVAAYQRLAAISRLGAKNLGSFLLKLRKRTETALYE